MSASAVAAADSSLPFVPAPREYRGCMGRIVPDLIEGADGKTYPGAYDSNPHVVFSWLLHLFCVESQAKILAFFKAAGDEDFLLSWTDYRDFNNSPGGFGAQIQQVRQAGFRPTVFLLAKEDGIADLDGCKAFIAPVLPVLQSCGVPRVSVGWELNFLPPGSVKVTPPDPGVLQPLIDWLAPIVRDWGAFVYVHFQPGYGAWQQDGLLFADFWNLNVNKLRGLLHQKVTNATDEEYQFGEGGLHDILLHFNGGSGCTPDSGDGTPFDVTAFEVNLEKFSENDISEDEMHRRATVGVNTPHTSGPTGIVHVMGSGCGQ